jgi:hypothetical protein
MRALVPALFLLAACAKPFAVGDWTRDRADIAGVPTRTSWRIEVPDTMIADLGSSPQMDRCLAGDLGEDRWCRQPMRGGCMELFRRPEEAVLLVWADTCNAAGGGHTRGARLDPDAAVDAVRIAR